VKANKVKTETYQAKHKLRQPTTGK